MAHPIVSPRFGRWRWAHFADRDVPRALFLAQHGEDDLDDMPWYLGSSDGGAATAPDGMSDVTVHEIHVEPLAR